MTAPRTDVLTPAALQTPAAQGSAPHIVAVLPRGEAIRNFVYTGVLDELAKDGRVDVFSVIPSSDLAGLLGERYHSLLPLEELREPAVNRYVREVLDFTHCRWLWSEAAKERWRLREIEAVSPRERVFHYVKKKLAELLASDAGLQALDAAERVAGKTLHATDRYIERLRELNPDLVFNASHVHSQVALPVVHAARKLRIPTATFLFSWDNLTSQGRIYPSYDYYFVWNESIRDDLLGMYPSIRPDQVRVTGTPQFDSHFRPSFFWSREAYAAHIGVDASRPIVLYTTGMANHMPGEHKIVEQIADLLADMDDMGRPQLVVRVYPKDRTGRFDALKTRRADITFPDIPWEPAWLTPRPEDTYLWTNMLRHADVGINVASTVTLELCMFEKPVLNVAYNPPDTDISPVDYRRYYTFDHYRPVAESGAVDVVESAANMRASLRQALRGPHDERAKRQRALLRNMFGDTLDGRSGERVKTAFTSILHA